MKFKDYKIQIEENFQQELFEANLIKEAIFNFKDMERVSKLLAKLASKKLGTKFEYAWTDKFTKDDGKQGYGIRYMSTDGLQIRFNNYIKASKDAEISQFLIGGVDYWKKGDGLTDPSLTLTWGAEINIVQLASQLFKAILTGKVPEITDEDFVTEAKQSPREQRQEFSDKHGISKAFSVSDKAMKDKTAKMGLSKEYEDWMKIKKGVSEVTEFSKKADADQVKLVSNSREFYADPNFVFEDMRTAALTVAKGKWRSLIVAGMGGIGKCVSGSTEINVIGLD